MSIIPRDTLGLGADDGVSEMRRFALKMSDGEASGCPLVAESTG